jgi:DNA repair ATPase RecN
MADATLETLHAELVRLHGEMQSRFSSLDAKFSSLESKVEDRFSNLEGRFSNLEGRFSSFEARVVGLPLIGESIAVLQRNVRMLTAAINDMARVNITAGEVEALHTELEQLAAKQNEIEVQLLQTRERLDRLEQSGMP